MSVICTTRARILKVIEGSPASEAALRGGGIVLELDGKPAGQLSYTKPAYHRVMPEVEIRDAQDSDLPAAAQLFH